MNLPKITKNLFFENISGLDRYVNFPLFLAADIYLESVCEKNELHGWFNVIILLDLFEFSSYGPF